MSNLDMLNAAASATGAGAGALLALGQGPVLNVLSAVAGSAVADMLKDVAGRALSSKERFRVDSAAAFIRNAIDRRKDRGEEVRQDGFLGPTPASSASELFEGVLLKCKTQYEEKKLRHIASLYASTLFNAQIPAHKAYQILYFVENITYQNLCIISFFGRREKEFGSLDLLKSYFHIYSPEILGDEVLSAARDLLYLIQQGVLQQGKSSFIEPTSLIPDKITLAPRGQDIFNLLELQYVLTDDVKLAVKPFEYQDAWGLDRDGNRNGRPVSG